MAQIIEDYCSFETSKLLKEKGFDVPSFKPEEWLFCMYDEQGKLHWGAYSDDWYCRVTLQMAMKWLREEHNKIIVPGISLDGKTSSTINHYIVGIWYVPENNGGAFCYTSPTPYGGYPSFEKACESAIKYCLEKLI